MTYTEYLAKFPTAPIRQDGKSLRDRMAEIVEVWSNGACYGYCILAMQDAGFSKEQIGIVLSHLHDELDFVSTDDAAKVCKDF